MSPLVYNHISEIVQAYYAVQNAPRFWSGSHEHRLLAHEWASPKEYFSSLLVNHLRHAAQADIHRVTKKIILRPGVEITPSVYLPCLMKDFMTKEQYESLIAPASSSAHQSPQS